MPVAGWRPVGFGLHWRFMAVNELNLNPYHVILCTMRDVTGFPNLKLNSVQITCWLLSHCQGSWASSLVFIQMSQTSIFSKRPVVHSASQWRQLSSLLLSGCLIVLACFVEDNENNVSAQNQENPQVVLNVCRHNYAWSRCVGRLSCFPQI